MIAPATPDRIKNPFNKFNAAQWADQLQKAGVQDVIFTGKQCYNDIYYPGKLGTYIGVDVLKPLSNALHQRGMTLMLYWIMHDMKMWKEHEDWRSGKGGECILW